MKLLKYIFLAFIITACKNEKKLFVKNALMPSKIDSLHSEESVEQYVRKFREPVIKKFEKGNADLIHNFLKNFELKRISEFDRNSTFDIDSITKRIADSLNVYDSYYKKDIDNNGFTDLLIIGDNKGCFGGGMTPESKRSCDFSVYALMNFGNDSIVPIDLIVRDLNNSIVPKLTNINNEPVLELHKPGAFHWIEKRKITENSKINLVFKFNSLIEFNKNPKEYQIEKIEFETENSVGERPYFKLTINNDQSATFNAINGNSIYERVTKHHNDSIPELVGNFKTVLFEEDYNKLINILNYMNFPEMKSEYVMRSLHHRDCSLKITYNNGKTKSIEDLGMFGTYGLNKVYEILFDLRFNQEWR